MTTKDIKKMPHAYTHSNGNPCGDDADYSCSYCGLHLIGDEVRWVAAGPTYANGEFAPCPNCGEENSIDRDDKDF
jgi:hypothetical protein